MHGMQSLVDTLLRIKMQAISVVEILVCQFDLRNHVIFAELEAA